MLVLSRQRDQTIMVGDDATALVPMTRDELTTLQTHLANTPADVRKRLGLDGMFGKLADAVFAPMQCTVVDIRGDKVRLGITAPKAVDVHRKEVYESIKRQGRNKAVPKGGAAASG